MSKIKVKNGENRKSRVKIKKKWLLPGGPSNTEVVLRSIPTRWDGDTIQIKNMDAFLKKKFYENPTIYNNNKNNYQKVCEKLINKDKTSVDTYKSHILTGLKFIDRDTSNRTIRLCGDETELEEKKK